jgi:hypothetical protein
MFGIVSWARETRLLPLSYVGAGKLIDPQTAEITCARLPYTLS